MMITAVLLILLTLPNTDIQDSQISAEELGTVDVANAGNLRYCGAQAVVISAKMVAVEATTKQFLNDQDISSRRGSTVTDIHSMCRKAGLHWSTTADGTAGWLSCQDTPVILHVRGQLDKPDINHWLVFGGMKQNEFRVVDAVFGEMTLSRSELLSIWDGVAIVISKNQSELRSIGLSCYLLDENVLVLLVLVGGFWISPLMARNTAVGAFVFLAIAISVYAVKGDSFFRNTQATFAARSFVTMRGQTVMPIELNLLRDGLAKHSIVLVDARTTEQYDAKHIPDAGSLPINASMFAYLAFAREHSKDPRTIVTYCNNVNCKWAEVCAKRLKSLGVEASFFPGGMEEWHDND